LTYSTLYSLYEGLSGFPPILVVVNLTHYGFAHLMSSTFI